MSPESPSGVIEEYPEADRSWAQTFLVSIAWNDLSNEQCRNELRNQLAAVHDSGTGADELFGDPWKYGVQRAQAMLTPQQRANAELTVQTGTALLTVVGMLAGLICVGFGLWIGFRDGWANYSWHYWQLAALAGGVGIAASAHLWWFYRLKGRFEASWLIGISGCLASIAAAIGIAVLGGEGHLPVPNWLAPLLGAAATLGSWFLPFTRDEEKPSTGTAEALDPSLWFDEVARLLRGRYGMNAKEAREALAAARQHGSDLGAAGNSVDMLEEFGSPSTFAIGLAVNTESALKRRWLLRRLLPLAVACVYGISLIPELLEAGISGWNIFIAIAFMVFIGISLYQLRRADRADYVQAKLAERRAHAQALQEGRDE
ncbi:hypothetical protein CQ010_04440 [Arthrobacter sp. MYb211]|uniref:hypothetical protein n=1 Tax=unclassified Arthrobacter TaxID=235627 RepID=UPI000CFDB21B|nr:MULTISPECIES: hypothetical protein [unclassified Arthrobacter]PRA13801.1 hypothetical protein CQ015_00435 [Arthrobacter sp. MYb221]PRC09171.1 hypothetical protein CQ010_04440 [Arthrobacter sp. MYb211]